MRELTLNEAATSSLHTVYAFDGKTNEEKLREALDCFLIDNICNDLLFNLGEINLKAGNKNFSINLTPEEEKFISKDVLENSEAFLAFIKMSKLHGFTVEVKKAGTCPLQIQVSNT